MSIPGSRYLCALPSSVDLAGHTRAAPDGGFEVKDRRRPTLPGGCPPSTIGAEGLNGSVRNGKRCFPLAIATEMGRDLPPRRGLKTARRPKKGKPSSPRPI